jgi:hypothetical protein
MEIGMLWFDNDPKLDLGNKVEKAARYYQNKYGHEPNLCFVHPAMVSETITKAGSVSICSNSTILPHHFWIGLHQSGEILPGPKAS